MAESTPDPGRHVVAVDTYTYWTIEESGDAIRFLDQHFVLVHETERRLLGEELAHATYELRSLRRAVERLAGVAERWEASQRKQ